MLQLDRRDFITALGGSAAVGLLSHEARADALENALLAQMQSPARPITEPVVATPPGHQPYPTVKELEAQVPNLLRSDHGYWGAQLDEHYVPVPHVQADYEMTRKHRWYDAARAVTVNDLNAFDANAKVSIEPFSDLIGRHFKQPKQGLGNDNSPAAHMWRTLANPDAPL